MRTSARCSPVRTRRCTPPSAWARTRSCSADRSQARAEARRCLVRCDLPHRAQVLPELLATGLALGVRHAPKARAQLMGAGDELLLEAHRIHAGLRQMILLLLLVLGQCLAGIAATGFGGGLHAAAQARQLGIHFGCGGYLGVEG